MAETGAIGGLALKASAVERRFGAFSVSVLRLEDSEGAGLVLVAADAIWFADAQAASLRAEIAGRTGLPEAAVALAASHTHGAPQPDPRFDVEPQDPAWQAQLCSTVQDAVEALLRTETVPVRLELGRGVPSQPVSINRRRVALYRIGRFGVGRRAQNLPNRRRPVDDRLTLAVLRAMDGRPVAALVHFTCHPVAQPRGEPGSDYPGELRRAIKDGLGADVPVVFLQGHCGDVRPNLRHTPSGLKDHLVELAIGPRFRRSRAGDVAWMLAGLAPAVDRALASARVVAVGPLRARHARLPVQTAGGRPTDRSLDVTAWGIGPDLFLGFASGEMLSGLAARDDRVLSVGYANGMVGYVAPSSDFPAGGYEIDGAPPKFGLPGRLDPATGDTFAAARDTLLVAVGLPDGPAAGGIGPA